MIFNTLRFAIFFSLVYVLYRILNHKWQNVLLLAASYIFYSFWDYRFLSLILASTLFNYYLGIKIGEAESDGRGKLYLVLCIMLNLLLLGFFKYFNFFAANLHILAIKLFGWQMGKVTLNLILPLGISFYTFQAMSYPIDVYRRVMKPTRHLLDFALFIAFFPQLVAGPIERAKNLLPQILNKRNMTIEQFYGGSWLIFWGLFKKIVIADNLAKVARDAFGPALSPSGLVLLIATYAFAFQVYADFSGYSDMARGLARLMGFDLMVNFRTPFFAPNVYDFWQRWHISLTTWIKEYLYYPLALAKFWGRQLGAPLVVVLTWAIMGLWHGAEWKFVMWGCYHAIVIVLYSRFRPYLLAMRPKSGGIISKGLQLFNTFFVFHLFCIGILFFAADSTGHVFRILNGISSGTFMLSQLNIKAVGLALPLIGSLVVMEYFQYKRADEMVIHKWPPLMRACVYYLILYGIILYGDFAAQRYYYFQF